MARNALPRRGLPPRKSLGQHFLLDPGICGRIVADAGALDGREVIEIGPGPGGLTRALLASGAERIVAIEVDPRAVAIVRLLSRQDTRLEILRGDATRLHCDLLVRSPRQVIANLPYNVGTPILIDLLRRARAWERLTIMLQQEVADRICAAPGSPAYGRLSVVAQWLCKVSVGLRLPPGAFNPPPKVWSAVVRLIPRPVQPTLQEITTMEAVTAAAFGQRRKMLRSALRPLGGAALLEQAGIDPDRRAETLDVAEFERLSRLVGSGLATGDVGSPPPADGGVSSSFVDLPHRVP